MAPQRRARGRRVTIYDVAASAGVSATTVSHALNAKGRVDPATRARAVAAAETLGYRASRAARALRIRRTGVIGFADAMRPESLDASYPSLTRRRVVAYGPEGCARLRELARRYDAGNVFGFAED